MKFIVSLLSFAALVAPIYAVSIETTVDEECDDVAGVGCWDVAEGVCCRLPGDVLGLAMVFTGLPTTGVGSSHDQADDNTCGDSCGTCTNPEDGRCCASCDGDGVLGGLWVAVGREAGEDEEGEGVAKGVMDANYVHFGENYFRIGEGVPEDVTGTLLSALRNRSSYADLPDFVHAYTMDVTGSQ